MCNTPYTPVDNVNIFISRLERAFGILKEELLVNNREELSVEACVIQTVQWAESKLVEYHMLAQRKDLQFFDKDPLTQEVLNEAAMILNKTGGLSFKKSLKKGLMSLKVESEKYLATKMTSTSKIKSILQLTKAATAPAGCKTGVHVVIYFSYVKSKIFLFWIYLSLPGFT